MVGCSISSSIRLSAGTTERHPCFFIIILLHYVPVKIAAVLVLFVIFGGLICDIDGLNRFPLAALVANPVVLHSTLLNVGTVAELEVVDCTHDVTFCRSFDIFSVTDFSFWLCTETD